MNQYELLYIIPAQYTEAEFPAIQKKVTALLEKAGVKISRNEHAGKLKLAYPIRNQRYGHYVLVEFSAEPAAVKAVTDELRLASEVIRAQVTRSDPRLRVSGPRTIVSHEEAVARAREAAAAPAPVAPVQVAAVPSKPALSSAELEQKIEEILNEQVA